MIYSDFEINMNNVTESGIRRVSFPHAAAWCENNDVSGRIKVAIRSPKPELDNLDNIEVDNYFFTATLPCPEGNLPVLCEHFPSAKYVEKYHTTHDNNLIAAGQVAVNELTNEQFYIPQFILGTIDKHRHLENIEDTLPRTTFYVPVIIQHHFTG